MMSKFLLRLAGVRRYASAAVAVLLLSTTASSAFAGCWSTCVDKFGGLRKWDDGGIYELQRCTETDSREGPRKVTCYYKRLAAEAPDGSTEVSTEVIIDNEEVPVVQPY